LAIKVGINGFGRIGRNALRAALAHPELEVVAVNDLTDAGTLAHLLMYDSIHDLTDAGTLAHLLMYASIHGACHCQVTPMEKSFIVNKQEIRVLSEEEPGNLPWRELGVEIVIESTGRFADGKAAGAHLAQGAKKVLITAPAKNEDITIVMGVNCDQYKPAQHHIISCASCTTNCLAPVCKVLHGKFGIVRGLMTTVHSYTNDQQILDLPHKDLRRARAAALSIIPTTTGAAKAVTLVLPELKGKLNGLSMRVPTPNVSVADLVAELARPVSVEEINAALQEAAENDLKGILAYCEAPLVSRDFNGNTHSAIIDSLSTMVVDGMMAKVIAWYDNEWGYSNRVVDTIIYMLKKGLD